MTKEVFTPENLPTHQSGIDDVARAVEEGVNAKTMIAAQTEHFKDIAARIKEEYEIPTPDFNKLVAYAYDPEAKDKADAKHELLDVAYQRFVKNNNRLDKGITMDGIAERDQILDALDD